MYSLQPPTVCPTFPLTLVSTSGPSHTTPSPRGHGRLSTAAHHLPDVPTMNNIPYQSLGFPSICRVESGETAASDLVRPETGEKYIMKTHADVSSVL